MSSVEPSSDSQDTAGASGADADIVVRGPLVWLNWQAMLAGQPKRTQSRGDSILVRASWQEWGLYSDGRIISETDFGPYRLMLAFPARVPRVGQAELSLVLRADNHLAEPGEHAMDLEEQDVGSYAGGDLGEQLASLLALALGRRLRSGGVTRQGYDEDLQGKPFYGWHHAPGLAAPQLRPILPAVANEINVEEALPYLEACARLDGEQAVVLQRAAHQFADALWWADADPRIAWIKLFGALEAAANLWAKDQHPDPVEQLKRRRGPLYGRLKRAAPDAIEIVASDLARLLAAQGKMVDFLLTFDPGPPQVRPEWGQVAWEQLEQILDVLYDHRSRDLHDGTPFPGPLCRPPEIDNQGVPAEAFAALGAQEEGGSWPASRLPMYLHTFVYLAGGALRRWWLSLGEVNTSPSARLKAAAAADPGAGEVAEEQRGDA